MSKLALLLLSLVLHGPVLAQDYPARPIRVIVPTAPGGITDGFVQLVGEALRAAWGQTVVMEHRPGAGGIIGTDAVAKAAPDGYTLLAGNIGPLAIAPYLQQGKVPYDPERDFMPVKLLATFSNVLVVNPSVQARNIEELIRLAKAKPGTLHFASPGIGQSQHLSGELFKRLAGVDLVHVPYKGTGPALTDLIGGQVQMMFSNIPPALPHIAAGKLRPLGVTSLARSAALPEVPTVAESGLADYQVVSWIGLFAPAGTSPAILARLHAEVTRELASTAAKERFAAAGADIGTGSAQDFAAFTAAERTKWSALIREANIRAE
jgi:tripartite-type tricarboxylate transporter receptor subunit TctC